jgi:hypothetical protein
MKAKTDVWMYSAQGAELFLEGQDIPKGYVDTPSKVKKSDFAKKVARNVNK